MSLRTSERFDALGQLLHRTATPKPVPGSAVERKRGNKTRNNKAKSCCKLITYNSFAFFGGVDVRTDSTLRHPIASQALSNEV